jgi:hypothetical protein
MFQLKWSRALIVLAMLVCLLIVGLVGTPSAHAAGVSLTTTTTTKTSTVKASARLCAFLKKSLPTRAGEAHLCEIKVVVTDVITRRTGVQPAPLSSSGCYPFIVNHSARYGSTAFGFSQSETFTYGCTPAPQISNHRCYGLWWLPGSSPLSQDACFQYPNGSGHTQAEDDVTIYNGDGPAWVAGYSDGQPNASIYDWCQC